MAAALALSACGQEAASNDTDATTPSSSDVGRDDARTDTRDVGPETDSAPGVEAGFPQWPVTLRPLSTSSDRRIVDDLGRDMLLRGVNITSLGEYWQGDPEHPPTMPTTEADWREMASLGVSVIRLIVHWSLLEPSRGEIDAAYLDQVDGYVKAAAAHGIYTVIDMHQDAYSAFIFTTADETCPAGTVPGKGWDGAPAWAVITDGLSTCTPGDRNAAPAVVAAWSHFYANTDGIRDRYVAVWSAVAARFAGRPEVAGYDIINEPEVPAPAAEVTPLYDALLREAVTAIRAAEAAAPFGHLVFIEPAIPAGHPDFGPIIPDPGRIGLSTENLVSAPHNYAETIPLPGLDLSFSEMNALFLTLAEGFGVATWIGEYGFWDTSAQTVESLGRYAADEDLRLLGGTWWQWRQPCGDPHSVSFLPGRPTAGTPGPAVQSEEKIIHLHGLGCPGDVDLGPTAAFVKVLGRGYPRAAPGRLTSLTSDPDSGRLVVRATATEAGGELVVWTPTSEATHTISMTGLRDLTAYDITHDTGGGRVLVATVADAGSYSLEVLPR